MFKVNWDCWWNFTHIDKYGNILFKEKIKNRIVDEGEKAIIDIFLRNNDSTYFSTDYFYVGLYYGSIAEISTLLTVPGEPSGNGYSRQPIARSSLGWPTMEKDNGDWRAVSSEITIQASGGNVGPISGAFLCTSSDDTGILVCSISSPVERTIQAGESFAFQLKVKCS
jgi:hypothetical protein